MSDNRKLLVQKFGGTSLADLRGFEASVSVIAQYANEHRVIVVLSAVKGVTDLLLAASESYRQTGFRGLTCTGNRFRALVSCLSPWISPWIVTLDCHLGLVSCLSPWIHLGFAVRFVPALDRLLPSCLLLVPLRFILIELAATEH